MWVPGFVPTSQSHAYCWVIGLACKGALSSGLPNIVTVISLILELCFYLFPHQNLRVLLVYVCCMCE